MRSTLRRFVLLALLSIATLSFCQKQAPANSAPKQAAGQQNSASSDNAIAEAQQRLAHRENEAAGEEEEHKQFKESPSVKWFASHTGLSLGAAYWVLVCLNFAIIAALIGWVAKKNLPAMFRSRTAAIRKSLDEARRVSEDANRRLSEIESRLARLDVEIAEMRKGAEAEAAAEEERIRAAAEQDRRKVIETAEQEIEAATKAARRELKAYAATLAVSIAEKKIQVDAKTDESLVRTFVRELSQNGGKGGH